MLMTHVLHLVAWVSLRAQRPLHAKRVVDCVGRWMGPVGDEEARWLADQLDGYGTCLSRAFALASRVPRSEVVIGIPSFSGSAFAAHAWVELDGRPLRKDDAAGPEIARLPAAK